MENRSKSLVKNTAILSLGTICTKGIMFLMTPLFTRWLSQSDYGIFDLIITYITLIVPIITLDCGEAVFRMLLEKNNLQKEKHIITNSIVIDVIGFIFSIIVTIIMTILFRKIRILIVYFLILIILEALNSLMIMVTRGLKKINIYTIANILFVITMVVSVTFFVKILNFKLQGILLGYIIGYVFSILFMIVNCDVIKYISIKNFDKNIAKQMLKYSLPLIPNALSWWIVNVSDRTIVSIFLGASTNAILAVANKIPNLCQTIFNVFNISWQENATETINDKDRDKYYTDIMNNMIAILGSICIVILSFNFIIFKYMFDDNYFLAYYQVPILIFAIIISMLAQFIGGIYIARKESSKNGKSTFFVAIINLILHFCLIKFIGIYAATLSTFISYLVLFIIRYIDIKKTINLKFKKTSIKNLIIFLYFFIAVYINWQILNIINVFLSITYFIYINKNTFVNILNKILKRC